MAINVSVQYSDGLLPDFVVLTQGYYLPQGNLFKCLEEISSFQL